MKSYEPIWWIYDDLWPFFWIPYEEVFINTGGKEHIRSSKSKLPVDEIPYEKQHGSDLHEVDINGKVIPHHPRLHLGIGTQIIKEGSLPPKSRSVCQGPHQNHIVLRELGAQNPQQTLAGVETNSTAQA